MDTLMHEFSLSSEESVALLADPFEAAKHLGGEAQENLLRHIGQMKERARSIYQLPLPAKRALCINTTAAGGSAGLMTLES